jgi:hypothetical protein
MNDQLMYLIVAVVVAVGLSPPSSLYSAFETDMRAAAPALRPRLSERSGNR